MTASVRLSASWPVMARWIRAAWMLTEATRATSPRQHHQVVLFLHQTRHHDPQRPQLVGDAGLLGGLRHDLAQAAAEQLAVVARIPDAPGTPPWRRAAGGRESEVGGRGRRCGIGHLTRHRRLAIAVTSDSRLPTPRLAHYASTAKPPRTRRLRAAISRSASVRNVRDRLGRSRERDAPLRVLDQSPLHRLGGRQRHHDRLVTGLDRLLADVVGDELAAGEVVDRPDPDLIAAGRPLQAQRPRPDAPGLDQTGGVDRGRSLALRRAWHIAAPRIADGDDPRRDETGRQRHAGGAGGDRVGRRRRLAGEARPIGAHGGGEELVEGGVAPEGRARRCKIFEISRIVVLSCNRVVMHSTVADEDFRKQRCCLRSAIYSKLALPANEWCAMRCRLGMTIGPQHVLPSVLQLPTVMRTAAAREEGTARWSSC